MNDVSLSEIEVGVIPEIIFGYLIKASLSDNSVAFLNKRDATGNSSPVFTTSLSVVKRICDTLEPTRDVTISRHQFINYRDPENLYTINTGTAFDVTDMVTEENLENTTFHWDNPQKVSTGHSPEQFSDDISSQILQLKMSGEYLKSGKVKVGSAVTVVLGIHRGKTGHVIGILDENEMKILKIEKRIFEDDRNIVVYFPVAKEDNFQREGLGAFRCSLFTEEELQ